MHILCSEFALGLPGEHREGDEPFFLNKPLTNNHEPDRRMACKAMTS